MRDAVEGRHYVVLAGRKDGQKLNFGGTFEMVKFMHLRHTDGKQHEDGRLHPVNHGGMTVAYTEEEDGRIVYAVAFCGKKDNFNYKTGRVKAAGRLKSPTFRYTLFPREFPQAGTVEQRLVNSFLASGLWRGSIWSRQKKIRVG